MKKILQLTLVCVFIGLFLIFTGCSSSSLYEIIRDRLTNGSSEEADEEVASDKEPGVIGYENDFTLINLDEEKISLSDYAGKTVVLNFWATWCPPCKAEIPDFIEVCDEYRDKGVQFIGISNEDIPTLKQFVQEFGINYQILVDIADIGGRWGIRAIPTTFILDGNGMILFKNVGMMTKSQLIQEIEKSI